MLIVPILVYFFATPLLLAKSPALTEEPCIQVSEERRLFCPEWRMEVTETWEQGNPKEVVFLILESMWPVKKITFHETGTVSSEVDLEMPSSDEKAKGRVHGTYIAYDEEGKVQEEGHFCHGKKEGAFRRFSNILLYEAFYDDGLLHGMKREFSENGVLISEEQYMCGLKHGTCRTFYKEGEKESESVFAQGLLQGKRYTWWKEGVLKEISTWRNGLLHSTNYRTPAYIRYSKEGKLVAQSFFVGGLLHGTQTLFHEPNGALSEKCTYWLGKKEGVHEKFDVHGKKCGEAEFLHGELLHTAWETSERGTFQATRIGPDEVRIDKGECTYTLVQGKIHGTYEELFASGKLFRLFRFVQGNLCGEQLEYFPSGVLRIRAHYAHGDRDGEQQEWFETGGALSTRKFFCGQKRRIFRN